MNGKLSDANNTNHASSSESSSVSGEDALLRSSTCAASGLKDGFAPTASSTIAAGTGFLAATRADCLRSILDLIVPRTRRPALGEVAPFGPSIAAISACSVISAEHDCVNIPRSSEFGRPRVILPSTLADRNRSEVFFLVGVTTFFVRPAVLGIAATFTSGLVLVDGRWAVDVGDKRKIIFGRPLGFCGSLGTSGAIDVVPGSASSVPWSVRLQIKGLY